MVIHDFECGMCSKNKPFTFEASLSLKDTNKRPKCPKCKSNRKVKKIIIKAFPKMQSWRAS